MNDTKLVVCSCPIASRSGYGDDSRDRVRALINAHPEWDIKIISQRWGATPLNHLAPGRDDDLISRLWLEPNLPKQPDIWIQITVPNEFQRVGKFNIGITAGIETTMCHSSWLEGLNRMDLNIVPSNFTKQVFESTKYQQIDEKTNQQVGVLEMQKPMEVIFEGCDLDIFHKVKEISKDVDDELKKIPEKFAFLFVGHWLQGDIGHDRKDIGMLIKVFLETFKIVDNPPALILKTSSASFSKMDRREIIEKIDSIRSSVPSNKKLPNIYLLHGDLEPEEMNDLYNHPKVKAMVSFTKGEGFGRPLLEFTTSGKPVITTNWSGHVDFLDPKYNVLIGGELTPVHKSAQQKDMILPESKWFTVNYNQASSILLSVFNQYKIYADKAKGTIHNTKTNWSLDKMKKDFVAVIDRYLENVPAAPQQQKLQLPKLKKIKSDSQKKIQLPKLKKVTS